MRVRLTVAMVAMWTAQAASAAAELRCPRGATVRDDGLLRSCVKAGVKHGPWELRFPDGRVMERGAYWRGKPDGDYRAWYPSGKLAAERHYRRGTEVGTWQRWAPNGRVVERMSYRRGRLEGRHQAWHDDGTRKLSAIYRNGKLESWYRAWDPRGVLTTLDYYVLGRKTWAALPMQAPPDRDCTTWVGEIGGKSLSPREREEVREAQVSSCNVAVAKLAAEAICVGLGTSDDACETRELERLLPVVEAGGVDWKRDVDQRIWGSPPKPGTPITCMDIALAMLREQRAPVTHAKLRAFEGECARHFADWTVAQRECLARATKDGDGRKCLADK